MAELVHGMAEKALQQRLQPPQQAGQLHASQPQVPPAQEPAGQTLTLPAALLEQWQVRLQSLEESVKALTSVCARLESGQSAILQNQQAIQSRLDAKT